MADTKRTLTALQALFANNVIGETSPQDLRDFMVSVYPGSDVTSEEGVWMIKAAGGAITIEKIDTDIIKDKAITIDKLSQDLQDKLAIISSE